uniref:40S ribosomal protein S15a-1-like n=1 Tax=Tanacetum cinerariifolium TaxID=118510 RepID=A0A6L2KFC5_TANCI|nr:40S ribosomal protein S15a-1-like [Tanacetum cinerariifolium]
MREILLPMGMVNASRVGESGNLYKGIRRDTNSTFRDWSDLVKLILRCVGRLTSQANGNVLDEMNMWDRVMLLRKHIYFARMVRVGVLNDAIKNMCNDEKKGKTQVMTRSSKVVI